MFKKLANKRRHRTLRAVLVTSVACLTLTPAAADEERIRQDTTAQAGEPADRLCRARYDGPRPELDAPPEYAVDAPLPAFYCNNARKWVFVYRTAENLQLYLLDAGENESYVDLFTAASRGEIAPWAIRTTQPGHPSYLVNLNPAVDGTFDYRIPAREFNPCSELAVSSRVAVGATECGRAGGAYAYGGDDSQQQRQ